ncbi:MULTISPECIES: hypothetical protein [Rhodovulum]|uniref:Uncharacterized protein n=1 Tax=Rhodovulum steppense TaxID=540251 RepID=A0A4R1YUJ1_9RHOB|nr:MULTISPECIES: hypothetical protein [Rhodovulum]TCM84752.1 hypothetical protein EV216_11069 [Rhodovulum steppense]
MTGKTPRPGHDKAAAAREERLKQALRANLARRKAQAKARGADKAEGQKEQG